MANLITEYKNGHKIVQAEARHIPHLAKNMREADIIEVNCFTGDPAKALFNGLMNDDHTFTLMDSMEVPYAMFGAGTVNKEAYIWMLGTDDIVKYKRFFIKICRAWVNVLVNKYSTVFNFVHEDNKLAIRWLEWCGAVLGEEVIVKNERFYQFKITKKEKLL